MALFINGDEQQPQTTLRHCKKTITFAVGAGTGSVGTVTVYTIAGRVLVKDLTVFCTSDVTEAAGGATLIMGTASNTDWFRETADADELDANEWWIHATGMVAGVESERLQNGSTSMNGVHCSEDIILTVGAQNLTGGVVEFDVWYYPITATGRLY